MEKKNQNNRRRAKSLNARQSMWAYVFIIPFIVIFLIFSLYPMVYSIYLSFTNAKGANPGKLIFFDNFKLLFGQKRFWHSFLNTIIIFAMNFIPQLVAALFFAVLFTSKRIRMRGKGAFQFIYFLPNVITAASVAIMFYALFQRSGINDEGAVYGGAIYSLLLKFGMNPEFNFFNSPWALRILIAFIQFWMWFGNSMIIYISAIKGISQDLFEAAEMDGASSTRTFVSITLPLIRPIMVYSLITSLIGGLQMFDIPFLIGSTNLPNGLPATETITMYIYNLAFGTGEYQYGLAAAASVVLFLVSLILSISMYYLVFRKDAQERKEIRKAKVKNGKVKYA